MAKNRKRQPKPKRKSAQPRDLAANNAEAVKGGRKAGGDQQEYLTVKLRDLIVS